MDISSFASREPLFVPSVKCQSLLGKAIQEHFISENDVAVVFSSSPSLRNSSAGANFLTNFKLNAHSLKLLETIFTPEDCFALSFAPTISLAGEDIWNSLFSFVEHLLSKNKNKKYFEASLRSLSIKSENIIDEQLQFLLSNLKRITTFKFASTPFNGMTSEGIANSIGENLAEQLEQLEIESSNKFLDSIRPLFSSKRFTKLKSLTVDDCDACDDDVAAISQIENLSSLSINKINILKHKFFNQIEEKWSLFPFIFSSVLIQEFVVRALKY
jgi:hypothetical protein